MNADVVFPEEKRLYAQRQIERAIDLKDEQQLKRAIAQYLETNPHEDDAMLRKARDQLEMLKAKYGKCEDTMEATVYLYT